MLRRLALALLAWFAFTFPCAAHDIPGELRVHAFAKQQGDRLDVLLRIPLGLLLNVDLPKQGPGYLALDQIDEGLRRAVAAADKDIAWTEDGRPLLLVGSAARISLPTDKSFASFDSALALIQGPRLASTQYVFWNQGYFDAHLEYALASPSSAIALDFRIAPGLRDRLKLDLRYFTAEGQERAYDLATGHGPIVLDPSWYRAASTFLAAGVEHILLGPDHLLFLICLILPFRRIDRYLVGVVSAFALAHSITLIAAAYGAVPPGAWFAPLVESLIAASILVMAVENVLRPRLQRRWLASALFGLVHGFGFSFMLQDKLQFAGSNLLVSLLAFNVGVEAGQLLVMGLLLPAIALVRRLRPEADRTIAVLVCAFAGHLAWHWMEARVQSLLKATDTEFVEMAAIAALLLTLLAAGWAAGRWLWHRRRNGNGKTVAALEEHRLS